jgi:hypothetical protein
MTIKIPKTTIFGRPIKGAIERALSKQGSVPEQEPQENIDPSEYVQIPGTNKLISKFELEDYNNLNWNDTHFKLQENGLYMPNPAIFMTHFKNVVESQKQGKHLLDANGNPISDSEREKIFNHLTTNHFAAYSGGGEGAWTWLDAKFEGQGEGKPFKFLTDHKVVSGELKSQTTQDLECKIKKDCYVEIDFDSQGFPTRKSGSQSYVQGENIRFWKPVNGRVAWFCADSGRALFNCGRDPESASSSLGVFGCAEGTSPQNSDDWIYLNSGIWVAKEKSLHNLNWKDADSALEQKGSRMLTIPEAIEFINHLKQNPTQKNTEILEEMLKVRKPWRSEWLGAKFEEKNGEMYVSYNGKTEKLDSNTLMQDKTGIDLDYWLQNHTNQGLPIQGTLDGDFYYWYPRDERVAWFYAYSDRASFDCGRYPEYTNSSLGVREVRSTAP